MMKFKKSLVAIATAGALVGLTACGGGSGSDSSDASDKYGLKGGDTVTMLVNSDSAPFASVDEKGNYEGFDVAMMEEITDRLDLKLDIRSQEFDTVIPTVALGQADVAASSIADTDERRKTVSFSLPNYTGVMSILVKKDSPIKEDSDLVGKRLAVKSASREAEYAEDKMDDSKLVYFNAEAPEFNALQSGSVDAAFFDGQVADKYKQKYEVRTISDHVNDDNRGAAIVINPKLTKLREDINQTLRDMQEDGTYKKLFEKYVTTEPVERQLEFLKDYYKEHPSNDYPEK
ncbi:MAG: substrate-binding periplasmic protein [Galactobacter sp.]